MREKMNGKVLFDEDGWNRLLAEVPKVIVIPCRCMIHMFFSVFFPLMVILISTFVIDETCYTVRISGTFENQHIIG